VQRYFNLPNMDQKQKIAVWTGMLAVVIAVAFLPWNYTYTKEGAAVATENAGYHFISSPPPADRPHTQWSSNDKRYGVAVDWPRVLLELAAIAAVTGGFVVTLADSGRKEARARHAWGSPNASPSDTFEAFTGEKNPEREVANIPGAEQGLRLLEADGGVFQPITELDGWAGERKDARKAELLALIGKAPTASPPSSPAAPSVKARASQSQAEPLLRPEEIAALSPETARRVASGRLLVQMGLHLPSEAAPGEGQLPKAD
jgi:hypothetical protein